MNMAEIMNFNASPVTASEKLWKVMRELFYADELAYILNSLQVTSFAKFSSEWISTLSERVKLLNQAGSLWYNIRPGVVSGLFSPIIRYYAKYDSVNQLLTGAREPGADAIKEMIRGLYEDAGRYAKEMRLQKETFADWIGDVNSHLVILEESEKAGWAALDVDEASVSELTGKLALMEKALEDAQESILPDSYKGGGKIAKSYGKILYKTLIGGQSISYLSVAGMFVSIGKIFYTAFSSYADVKELTEEITECKLQYSLRQQALAQTKTMIRFLQSLKLRIIKSQNHLDRLVSIWDQEKEFLNGLLWSYEKGADPKQTVLVAETAFWGTLADLSDYFMEGDFQNYEFQTIEL